MSGEPWTFEPFECHTEPTWEIYDPNLARIVAVFSDRDEATAYLKWRNAIQADRRSAVGTT